MWQLIFTRLAWRDIYIALALLAAFLLASWLVYFVLNRVVKRLVAKSGTALDNMVLESLEKPVLISVGLLGLYLALLSLPLTEAANGWVSRLWQSAFVIVGIYTGVRLTDVLLRWYLAEVSVKTRTALADKIAPGLRLLIPIIAGLLGVVALLRIFGLPVEAVEGWLVQHGGRLGLILAIFLAALFALARVVPRVVTMAVARGKPAELKAEDKKRADTLAGVLVATGQIVVTVVVFFMLLAEVGVNIAPVLAGAGIAGLAIGFGAQSLIKDIIAGVFVILENQYRVGDVVRLADIGGLVEEINLRRTVLRDLDGIVHSIPNGEVRVASNFTRGFSRVNLNISVGYGEDLDRVMAVINRVGKELAQDPAWAPLILQPPQVLRVDNLGDSGIDIKILGDTQPIQQWAVTGELRLRLKRAFDKEGIEIPWPHTKVYFGNSPFGAPSK